LNLNFDELLEKSFDEEEVETKILITDKDFENFAVELGKFKEDFGEYKRRENLNLIMKPHGTISNIESMKVIPSHTKSLSMKKKDVLHNTLKNSELVCVGYSASDKDIVEILKDPEVIDSLKGLYWVSHGDMNKNVKEILHTYCNLKKDAKPDKIYIKMTSDNFFKELVREIDSRNITLTHFPERFFPLTVVIGDRREEKPKTPGDFLAFSTSTMDLKWILKIHLRKDVEIWGDKIVAVSPKDELEDMLGSSNLLIIGSPATNWLARKINQTAFFRFHIDLEMLKEADEMEKEIRDIYFRGGDLLEYKERNLEKLKELMQRFKGIGFPDPVHGTKRGEFHDDFTDYGVVSFCEHPYSEDHYAILVAGHHLAGTMWAQDFLSRKEVFRERPLGGIIKIRIPQFPVFRRLMYATPEWDTPPYSIQKLEENFKNLLKNEKKRKRLSYTKEEVEKYLKLLDKIKKLKS
jgi:hypothetical protein